MTYRVVAISPTGVVVLNSSALTREEADEILAATMAAHPDCEVALYVGDAVMLSAGPAPAR